MPFILAIGDIPKSFEDMGSLAISRFFNSKLLRIPCEEHPNNFLSEFENRNEIVQLIGDAAMSNSLGGSWLESLGDWQKPVILLASPESSGHIPGTVSAHVCLCKRFSVPLIGIVQLGGEWDSRKRSVDCLPWSGFIPSELLRKDFNWESASLDEVLLLEDISINLKKNISFLSL